MEQNPFMEWEEEIEQLHRYHNIHFREETPIMDLLRKWEYAGGISIGRFTSRILRLIREERNRTEHRVGKTLPVSLHRDEIRELTTLSEQICRILEVTVKDPGIANRLEHLMQEAGLKQYPVRTLCRVLEYSAERRAYLEQKIEGHPDKENIWA